MRLPVLVRVPDVGEREDRIPVRCAVAGCRRVTGRRDDWEQWVCARHWRSAPRLLREHFERNQVRAMNEDWPERLVTYHNILWDQIVAHINERTR